MYLETQQPFVDMYFDFFFAFIMFKTTIINWKYPQCTKKKLCMKKSSIYIQNIK
jgi:hypothetical protein